MRIAISEWNEMISPVFDETGTVRLVNLDTGEIQRLPLSGLAAGARAEVLRTAGVSDLLCGAISPFALKVLTMSGIRVHAWLHGPIDRALQAFTHGDLDDPRFTMPGCQALRDNPEQGMVEET
ncbi:hypothetical protein KQI52_09270 [bacterium]|nr:hypothetical protein [bacterium]